MTKKKKSLVFQSNYGGGNVQPAQYIIELICTKKARMSKKTLSHKFWTDPEWSGFFKRWLKQVHTLIRRYDSLAIIGALNDPKSGMRWSIHSEFMINLIKEHHKRIKSEKREVKVDAEQMERARESMPRQPQMQNALQDLLDIDTEHMDMSIDVDMGEGIKGDFYE